MLRMCKEYGGFLPLELNKTGDYYQFTDNNIIRFNCAKAAIAFLVDNLEIKRIYVPCYLCPNVCKEIENHGKEVIYYNLEETLLPSNRMEDNVESCIYLVDYFGVMDTLVSQFAECYVNSKIIMDNSHSFYHKPIMKRNIFNIYSCKKFFGVPDGAYLIAECLEPLELKETFSSQNSLYLLESLEHGTNYCYKEKKDADAIISHNYGKISRLAENILQSIDYESIKRKRMNNLNVYQEAFGNINLINIEENSVPYVYPLNVGINIKKGLIEKKIYVPTLWGHLLTKEYEESYEFKLSDETLFLPLDQRYDESDMKYIIEEVKKELQNFGMFDKKEKGY